MEQQINLQSTNPLVKFTKMAAADADAVGKEPEKMMSWQDIKSTIAAMRAVREPFSGEGFFVVTLRNVAYWV